MERRRRGALRYSLSAMLLLTTLVAVWLGYQVKWMKERAEAIAWIEDQADFWDDLPVEQGAKLDDRAPFPLAWMGAPGVRKACVCVANKQHVAKKQRELDRLFPESDLLVVSPGPGYQGKHAALVR